MVKVSRYFRQECYHDSFCEDVGNGRRGGGYGGTGPSHRAWDDRPMPANEGRRMPGRVSGGRAGQSDGNDGWFPLTMGRLFSLSFYDSSYTGLSVIASATYC